MRFHALELAFETIAFLRRLVPVVRRHDPRLARQISDAGSSIVLNLGEGNRRQGRDRRQLWCVSAGSAEEVRVALRIAVAWGYLTDDDIEEALDRLDFYLAILWKLTH